MPFLIINNCNRGQDGIFPQIIVVFFLIPNLGLEEEAKLPEDLAGLVHKLVVIPVLNPVKVTKPIHF